MFGVDFVDLLSSLYFLTIWVHLTFVVKLVWWYYILLTFACLKSFLFLHQFSMRSFPGTVILVVDFSLSVLYRHSTIPFWPEEFLLKDQLLSIWSFPCMLFVASFLLLLMFSLCLVFVSLISMCLGLFLLGFILFGIFVPLGLDWLFPFHVGVIFNYNLLKIFSYPFFFSSSSGTPIIWRVVRLTLS